MCKTEPKFGAFRDDDSLHQKKSCQSVKKDLTPYNGSAITLTVKRKSLTKEGVIKMLRDRQGKLSINKFAASLGVSQPYLSDIYNGKREPGPKVLSRLGITQTVKYERLA